MGIDPAEEGHPHGMSEVHFAELFNRIRSM